MSATLAPTALPTGSAICWVDATSLIVQYPTTAGPYLTRFPKTATGLREALGMLLENPAPRTIIPFTHTAVKRGEVTTEQRAGAAATLRRMLGN